MPYADFSALLDITENSSRFYDFIAAPLTGLLKRNSLQRNGEAENSFNQLKHALSAAPVLQLSDFDVELVVECDASVEGIGAILSNKVTPWPSSVESLLIDTSKFTSL